VKNAVSKRPVNLELSTVLSNNSSPRAIVSILHRLSGIIIFPGIALLLCALDYSLKSPESFDSIKSCLGSPIAKFFLWVVLASLVYHFVAGVKHLLMDMGLGETIETADRSAVFVLVVSVVLIVVAGWWIW
jgi:succinate dehydrogenase / fumarate reductase cytochrome b subunit